MSGRNLLEMEASQMMDCLHFLFEEDFTNNSEDHARSRSAIRTHLYQELYGVEYKFKMKDRKEQTAQGGLRAGTASNSFQYPTEFEDFDSVEPFDPNKNDAFSPRTKKDNTPPPPTKTKFVDASTIPVMQSFDPSEALG
jgi:hypothetical protein